MDIPPPEALLSQARRYQLSAAIYVAAKLGIADLLASGPRGGDALAAAWGMHAPSLSRLLRALASEGTLGTHAPGRGTAQ